MTFGFFNAELVSGDYDRKYTAEQLAEYFSYMIGNGVFGQIENCFKVTPSSGMSVSIAPGFGWIKGYWVKSDAPVTLTHSASPSVGYRIDLIALRFDLTNRSIMPVIIKGSTSQVYPASDPSYNRSVSLYDLVLARVSLSSGDSAISSSMIEDLRSNYTYCGIVDTFASRLIPTGSIQNNMLAEDSVGRLNIIDGSVTTEKLAQKAVTAEKVEDHSIGWYQLEIADAEENGKGIYTSNIRNGSITTNKLADGAVTTDKLANRAVTAAKIALLAITEALLGNDSVGSSKLKNGSVTTEKLAQKAVTAEKVEDHSIGWYQLEIADAEEDGKGIYTSNIRNEQITTAKLKNSAVTTQKLNDSAVTAQKLASSSVTTQKLNDGAVTTQKLNNGAVTAQKLGSDILPSYIGIKHGTETPTTSTISNGQIYLKHS